MKIKFILTRINLLKIALKIPFKILIIFSSGGRSCKGRNIMPSLNKLLKMKIANLSSIPSATQMLFANKFYNLPKMFPDFR